MPMKIWKVWFSNHTYTTVTADSKKQAREKAWEREELDKGYNYGWDKEDFMKNATVEEF